ncbi:MULTISPECIES: hypothetical protein [unclassified Aureispira]|uniref:hypothetical protein n=1 Tax=unclassified Aureispira TaxID=2649989 RepID=UPI000697AF71|nr:MULTISPECIES: hypothetical protein [unclassified Aureispira]WMX14171.1 hypothetical protein QP953_25270 [Aureispira sp. CCB-E]
MAILINKLSLFLFVLLFIISCSPKPTQTLDELYEKTIFTTDTSKTKVKTGDKVTIYYCLKNKDKVIASSDDAIEPSVITIPPNESLDKFQYPLTWLGLGDSCVATIDAADAKLELSAYKEHFNAGDKATFIYKVLKIN